LFSCAVDFVFLRRKLAFANLGLHFCVSLRFCFMFALWFWIALVGSLWLCRLFDFIFLLVALLWNWKNLGICLSSLCFWNSRWILLTVLILLARQRLFGIYLSVFIDVSLVTLSPLKIELFLFECFLVIMIFKKFDSFAIFHQLTFVEILEILKIMDALLVLYLEVYYYHSSLIYCSFLGANYYYKEL